MIRIDIATLFPKCASGAQYLDHRPRPQGGEAHHPLPQHPGLFPRPQAPPGGRHPLRRRQGDGDAAGADLPLLPRYHPAEPVAAHVIYLSPQGQVFTEQKALALRDYPHLLLLCGHYEGVDERVLTRIVDEEISIGDYVLTGGELGALVITDAVGPPLRRGTR